MAATCRMRLLSRVGCLVLALSLLAEAVATAEVWRSPVHDWTLFQIEKPVTNPGLDLESAGAAAVARFRPLPPEVPAAFGAQAVDYESALAGYLPPAKAAALAARLDSLGLHYTAGIDRRIQLPWHAFDAGNAVQRTADFSKVGLASQSLPNLYLVQFAYPLEEIWLQALSACGVQRVAYFAQRTFLVKAADAQVILSCGIASYLSWIDSYLTTDRISPDMLKAEAPFGYTLHYAPGTDLNAKAAGLNGSFSVVDRSTSEGNGLPFLQVLAKVADLRRLVAVEPDLLSVTYHAELAPSDERQGQITAGNYNANGTVTSTGYKNWLNGRGLLTDSNQQIVGMIDTGYEDGRLNTTHNPDLSNPKRLVADVKTQTSDPGRDLYGHGTMVGGIIAGDGTTGFGSGISDPQGFFYGTGISPRSKLVVAQLPTTPLTSPATITYLKDATAFCRNDQVSGADRAFIINNSYNNFIVDPNGFDVPANQYDETAQAFDALVIDGNIPLGGSQPTSIVFSAGNYAYDYPTGNVRVDSVCSPATAKNVITVGSTTSYRPVPEPPLPCQPDPVHNSRPPDQDATHVSGLGLFSGLGGYFAAAPSGALANTVRIKPDLVAPGVRVFSTVPFNGAFYFFPVGCMKYYPTSESYHTYGTGTSFSAPVVSGAAALARKWFLDRGANPNPSLIKAALIATADDLIEYPDRRPSFRYGWGRVSINRLTDPTVESFFRDNPAAPVSTGQTQSWTRTVSNPSKDIYIVLVWSDPPSDVPGGSQVALKNDLTLTIEEGASGFPLWQGNNFRENKEGVDNGYSHRFMGASDTTLVDSINNVEAIFIPAGTFSTGKTLTIKVKGTNVSQGPQAFSVYAWNLKPSS